jgi:PAS domain S-box-containing protein
MQMNNFGKKNLQYISEKNLKNKNIELENTKKAMLNVLEDLAVEKSNVDVSMAKERAILLSIGDGLFATDEKGVIIFINKKAEKLLGVKSANMLGKVFCEVLLMEDEKNNIVLAKNRPTNIVLKKGFVSTTNSSYYYVRKDKTKFPIALTVRPIILEGRIIGAIEVFRDVTQEKAVDKAKSEFISVASHQLKTPATAVKLLAERLLSGKMGEFTDKQKEYFNDIYSSNERMINLVNSLLKVSRIEVGAYTVSLEKNDAYIIVKSVLDELKYIINKKRLKLTIISPKNHVILLLDEHMFRIAINNLVTNAIQYTHEGGEIQVECKVEGKGVVVGGKTLKEDYFVVTVSDNGYGIPKNVQNKVFTKFFRADNAREKHTDGTGLGLYIVKSTLEYSGGLIWFTSQENKGTSFYVAIPMTEMCMKEKIKIG